MIAVHRSWRKNILGIGITAFLVGSQNPHAYAADASNDPSQIQQRLQETVDKDQIERPLLRCPGSRLINNQIQTVSC